MANLVANLLQVSRRHQPQISTIDLAEEIEGTLELVHYRLRNHCIELAKEYATLPPVPADRQQVRQLFLNLFTNAIDAMRDCGNGRLTIRLSTITLPPMPVGKESERGGWVDIAIEDTGQGIPEENLSKVLEPFFTTKPEGQGTGLGMAICQRIVQEHGGELTIDSEVGAGTTVRVRFPVAGNGRTGREL